MRKGTGLTLVVIGMLCFAFSGPAFAYLHPVHSRFLQRDPAGYVDGMNAYQYARVNPVVVTDASGLWGPDIHQLRTWSLATTAVYILADTPKGGGSFWIDKQVGEWANSPDVWSNPPDIGFGFVWAVLFGDEETQELMGEQILLASHWHFPGALETGRVDGGSEYAWAEVKKGISKCNLMAFSQGLHPLQDTWSHAGVPGDEASSPTPGLIGHSKERGGWTSTSADDPKQWPKDAQDTLRATYEALLDFKTKCPCILEGPHTGKYFRDNPTPRDPLEVKTMIDEWYPRPRPAPQPQGVPHPVRHWAPANYGGSYPIP